MRCDVLVIGAGITGALVAFHLAEAGFSTVIVDKREAAWGSTAASTALLQYEIDTPSASSLTVLANPMPCVLTSPAATPSESWRP